MTGQTRQQRRQRERDQRKQLLKDLRRSEQLRPTTELGATALDYTLHGAEAGDVIIHRNDHLAMVAVVMHVDCLSHADRHLLEAVPQIETAACK